MCVHNHWAPGRVAFRLKAAPVKTRILYPLSFTIAESIRFLARQGIALRGDGNEGDSNFTQLLHLRAVDQPQLLPWLERKTDKYTSPQVQNKILTVIQTVL